MFEYSAKLAFRSFLSAAAVCGLVSLPAAPARAAEAGHLEWQPTIEVAAGGGTRGPWRQNDSNYDYVDDPSVAIGDDGVVSLVWVDQARKDVFYQRFAANGSPQFAAPPNVSRSASTFSWLPRIVLAPGAPDTVYILWQEIIFSGGSHGGDVLFARSEDGGRSFSPPVNLSQSPGGDGKGRINAEIWSNGSLDILAAPGGRVVAAWTEYDGALWIARSTDAGRRFSRAQRVAGSDAAPARGPALAGGTNGEVLLAWTIGEDAEADIRIARSPDGGDTFGEASIVAKTRGYSDAPKIAVDSRGTVHLVYAESAGGPFSRYRVMYSRSTPDARVFAPPVSLQPSGREGMSSAAYPSLSIDSRDDLYVVWENFPSHRERPRGLRLTISRDGGESFTTPILIPGSADPNGGSNGSHQGLLMRKLAVNGAGNVAVVNSSLKENAGSRVWLMRAIP